MSDVSNRSWDYWINKAFFESENKYMGKYECILIPSLMAQQTVEFLENGYQIGIKKIIKTQPVEYVDPSQYASMIDSAFCLKVRDYLDTTESVETIVSDILATLEALSICVDFSIKCNEVRFIADSEGHIFSASRRPLSRGMAFEVEERGAADEKLMTDFSALLNPSTSQKVAIKHYLTGMTLLGLEDQLSGLTDAAFMQFFQGIEAICEIGRGKKADDVLRAIARMGSNDSRDLQIIAHQAYQVRHLYFGHGDIKRNLRAIDDYEEAMQVTKQVLVARYLCKRLIDIQSGSHTGLIREMGFYPNGHSESFNGDVALLNDSFKVNYPGRNVTIFDENGKEIEKYMIE